jgi:antitoxin HigA-1
MTKTFTKPVHPGEILLEEFLNALGITQYKLAKDTGVSQIRISEIVRGKRAISADTALRFSRYFGNSAQFWLNLQTDYDLELAEEKLGKKLLFEVKVLKMSP